MGPQQDPKKPHSNRSVAATAAGRKAEKAVRYRECWRNYASSIGGYAMEGCREFMAAGEEGTPAALLCTACSCHRSFHKLEVDPPPDAAAPCDCSSVSSHSRRS